MTGEQRDELETTRGQRASGSRSALDASEAVGLAGLLLLAAFLLFANLGDSLLWQDEAQTALVARTILEEGVPRGSDGRNFFSQELGREYGANYLWKWHTWLSFYVEAASLALLGETTLAARLPFALFGLATVLLAYFAGRTLWRDPWAAGAGAFMLAVSVPFLILSRQARWYSLATFFTLLGLHAYARFRPGAREPVVTLAAAVTLVFHTHYFYAGTLLATLFLHAALLERQRIRPLLVASAAAAAVNLPWIAWFTTVRYGDSYAEHLFSPVWAARFAPHFAALFFAYILQGYWFLVPPLLAADRALRREPVLAVSRETLSHLALLGLLVALTIVCLAAVTPGGYFRYLAPLTAVGALVSGLFVGALLRRSPAAGCLALAVWLAVPAFLPGRHGWLNPLHRMVHEITHDFEGPMEGLVAFLETHARPGDVVAITYGDMPLKFYTDLRVLGGLTGEDITQARDADWIIPRRSALSQEEKRVRTALVSYLSREKYRRYVVDAPDTTFQNREDPRLHRFGSARASWPRLVVYGRRRTAP